MKKAGVVFAAVVFALGLYAILNYGSRSVRSMEGFGPRCPNILVQSGNEIWLKNTDLADVPGVNPMVFHNLEEYVEFVQWQRSRNINCPVLFFQKTFDPQNQPVYKVQHPSLLNDATRDDPPYNTNSYPGIDLENQDVGRNTVLDVYHEVGQMNDKSVNPMDPNWGGSAYTDYAVKSGQFKDDEVSIQTA